MGIIHNELNSDIIEELTGYKKLPKGYDHESQYENVIKSSRLYTPPPAEYQEPTEDLYDWYTGKVRE